MDISANPLLSLFGAAPAPSIEGLQAGVTNGKAATGFAQLILGQLSKSESLVELPSDRAGLPEDMAALVSKLGKIIEKITTLLSDENVPLVTDQVVPVLTELAEILEELDEITNGAFVQGLMSQLLPSDASKSELGIKLNSENLNELEITAIDPEEAISPEVLALAVLEIAKVVQSDIKDVVKVVPETVANIATKFIAAGQSVVPPQRPANSPKQPTSNTSVAPISSAPALDTIGSPTVIATVNPLTEQEVSVPQWFIPNAPKLSEQAQSVLSAIGKHLENGPSFSPKVTIETSLGQILEIPKELLPILPQDGSVSAREAIQSIESTSTLQSARAAESQTPRFSQAVVSQVRAVDFQEGITKVELTPRGLGSVEIEMKTNSDGSLSVVVRAENPHVLSSLREERDLLALAVSDAGQGTFEFQGFSKEEQSQDQGGQEFGSGTSGDAITEGADVATDTVTIGGGQLDLVT